MQTCSSQDDDDDGKVQVYLLKFYAWTDSRKADLMSIYKGRNVFLNISQVRTEGLRDRVVVRGDTVITSNSLEPGF